MTSDRSPGDPPAFDRPVRLDTAAQLDDLVSEARVVLVEFYTEGCGICAGMEPVLGIVSRETEAVVAMVNPRDDPPLVDRFQVRSVPLFVLFVDGEPVDRRANGFVSAEELCSWIAGNT